MLYHKSVIITLDRPPPSVANPADAPAVMGPPDLQLPPGAVNPLGNAVVVAKPAAVAVAEPGTLNYN